MSYKIIDLPALGRPFNATDIIEVSANGTGSYKANIGNFTLGGENYIFVNTNGTPEENGAALKSAYLYAQTLTPNGNPISSVNRVIILLSPGYYSFNESIDGPFTVDQSYIDLESLSGNTDVYFSSIQVLSTFASPKEMTLVGINTTKNNFYSHGAFAIASAGNAGENIIVKNCIGGDYSFSSFSRGFRGLYDNCVGGSFSFCSTGFSPAPTGITSISTGNFQNYGTIKNCTAGDFSFVTGSDTPAAGTIVNSSYIENCKSTGVNSFCFSSFRAQNSGVIRNCEAADGYSFCATNDTVGTGASTNTGAIINCELYSSGFCIYAGSSGINDTAKNAGLISGCYSSGTQAFVVNDAAGVGNNQGTIKDCFMTGQGFCGALGINSGIISNCTAQDSAFCSANPLGNSGQILRCTLLDWAFTVGTTGGGRVVLGIDITGVVNF
jgi:hypothetical protein